MSNNLNDSKVNPLALSESADTADTNKADGEIAHLERGKFQPGLDGVDEEIAEFQDSSIVITPEENKRLKRMIDKHVLALMLGTYFCQSLDKGTLSFSIMGIREDAKLVGNQYSWLTTCLYLAVLVCEFPQNYLLQRLPVAKWFSFNIVSWGIVVAASAAANNFAGLVVLRTLLGVFECSIQPTFIILTSMWYEKEEQVVTVSLWYCMNGLQTAVGGLIAYGFFHIQGTAIKNWQFLFLILGLITIVWGLFVGYWLPDSPMRGGRFWSQEDRTKMVERVRENGTGIQNKKWKKDHVVDALTDPQVWAFVLIQFANTIPTGGLGAYSNIIISQNLGFSVLQAYLLSIAQGTWQILVLLSAAWLATKTKQTLLIMIVYTIPNIISAICFITIPNNKDHAVVLLIMFYFTIFFNAQSSLSFSLLTRNVGGQNARLRFSLPLPSSTALVTRSALKALFQAKDAPLYRNAFAAQLGCYCFSIILFVFLRLYYMRKNLLKRRATALAKGLSETTEDERNDEERTHVNAFSDLTDRQNSEFRYSY
ncbi:major facilitator superfamily domain-containing protein [Mrakia frigida]|uniref:major facilitator superfamily domain-containing protein n=1 Tax=Mrakia frigida TaxID=29902 RepID=UPI003FCC0CC7